MKKAENYKFLLYVAGDGPNSTKAITNLNALCREHLPERHEIEIIDLLQEPERALSDGVMITPLLVRVFPRPVWRIAGSLNDHRPILLAFGLPV